jgi:bifunctional UDP-N-acetylglucosamine pyrophosphorylase/glucosamine-1-phosphate N-acetyltransferase
VTDAKLVAVVMAAGHGTRMRSSMPKHLHPLLGRRLVDWVIEAARAVPVDRLVVVSSGESAGSYEDLEVAVQAQPLGTGDAVRSARDAVGDAETVLVLSGDTPLLTAELLSALLETHGRESPAATVLSFRPADLRDYGRIVRDQAGALLAIVEATDASPEELAIGEVNSSIYAFSAGLLWPALERLTPHNAQGELYLTDAVRELVEDGRRVAVHVAADPDEAEGVNTRVELAAATARLRERISNAHMLAGVTIVDPQTTMVEATVALEADSTIHPFTVLRGTTTVARGAHVGPHVVAVDAAIGADVLVGPFCYLRPGTVLEAGSKAGTFVELKNSRIGERTKVPHLSYLGDADVGEDTNVGAGAITVNYSHRPGVPKQRTTIGRNVRTGVDNAFVAPVTVGDDAMTGAGSIITDDVPEGALGIARARQSVIEGFTARAAARARAAAEANEGRR